MKIKFNEFMNTNVNLPVDLIKKAEGRINSVQNTLKSISEIDRFEFQGSWSRGTVIKPKREDEEFDVDMVAIRQIANFDNNNFNHIAEFRAYSKKIYDKIKSNYTNVSLFGGKPSKATQIIFTKEFHLDVVPLVVDGNGNEWIYDTITNKAILSNPIKFTRLFDDISNVDMIDATKLIKYFRNYLIVNEPGFGNIPSIAIDTHMLAAGKLSGSGVERVIKYLEHFLAMQPNVQNPVVKTEFLKSDDKSLLLLKTKIKEIITKIGNSDYSGLHKSIPKTAGAAATGNLAALAAAFKPVSAGLHVSGKMPRK